MKKVDTAPNDTDELRPEYRREDFGVMTRGKYAAELREASNVVVLDADVAKAFPNGKAVIEALRSPAGNGTDRSPGNPAVVAELSRSRSCAALPPLIVAVFAAPCRLCPPPGGRSLRLGKARLEVGG